MVAMVSHRSDAGWLRARNAASGLVTHFSTGLGEAETGHFNSAVVIGLSQRRDKALAVTVVILEQFGERETSWLQFVGLDVFCGSLLDVGKHVKQTTQVWT